MKPIPDYAMAAQPCGKLFAQGLNLEPKPTPTIACETDPCRVCRARARFQASQKKEATV